MQENPRSESSAMNIPDHAIERIARCLLPKMLTYFEAEANQHETASEKGGVVSPIQDATKSIA